MNFSFATSAPGDFTINGATADVPDQTTAASVVGGPVAGDNKVRYYCDYPQYLNAMSSSETGVLNGTGGQPQGTTYSWSISGPCIITSGATSLQAKFRSTGPTSPGSFAVATLVYTVKGVSASSTCQITVRKPQVGSSKMTGPSANHIYYPNDPVGDDGIYWGFDSQMKIYTIVDQYGDVMAGVPVNERLDLKHYADNADVRWPLPANTGGATDGNGQFIDHFSVLGYSSPTGETAPTPPLYETHLKRSDKPNYVSIYTLRHRWFAGYTTSDPSPGYVEGCPLVDYPAVTFNTNGVTGE